MKEKTLKSHLRAFQLKGSLVTLTVLELLKSDISAISSQFLSLIKQTPDLFRRMPVIIDLNKISLPEDRHEPDFEKIKIILQENGLIPVGVRGGNSDQERQAVAAGFAVMNNTRLAEQADSSQHKASYKTNHTVFANKTDDISEKKLSESNKSSSTLITHPVRSGQQIYAKNADLIILSSVSPGAEVLADGSIHIYGALRGRALAGVKGNHSARIFCQKLEAELVSIAGQYWVNEDLSALKYPDQTIQIYLDNNDRLQIDGL